MATLRQQIDELQRQGEQVKNQVMELIQGLEDNPRIHRMGKRAFFMNSRHLGSDDWTPAHHDFKYQHELVLERLKGMEPQKILGFLGKAVASGKIRRSSSPGDVVKLHPDVIRQIRSIIEK